MANNADPIPKEKLTNAPQHEPDYDTPANSLPYSNVLRVSYALSQGRNAGVLHDMGGTPEPSDSVFHTSLRGVAGSATISAADYFALEPLTAGVDVLLDGNAAGKFLPITIDSRQYYIARKADNGFLEASGTVGETQVADVSADGYRLEDAADRDKPTARWGRNKQDADTVYTDTQRFTQADEQRFDRLGANSITVSSVTATGATEADTVQVRRVPGQPAIGSFTGDTGTTTRRVQSLVVSGTSITVAVTGSADELELAIGDRTVGHFADAIPEGEIAPGVNEYEWVNGNFQGWFDAGTAYLVSLVAPSANVESPDADDVGKWLKVTSAGKNGVTPQPLEVDYSQVTNKPELPETPQFPASFPLRTTTPSVCKAFNTP